MALVEFRSPDGSHWAIDPSDVSRVKPSSVEPDTVTEVYSKDGTKNYAEEPYTDVMARLNGRA